MMETIKPSDRMYQEHQTFVQQIIRRYGTLRTSVLTALYVF